MRREFPIPLGGLSDNEAASKQPLGTTGKTENCRGIDPKTGRVRLSQRAGSSKLSETQVTTTGKIDSITAVTYDEPRLTYTQETSSFAIEWEKAPVTGGAVHDTSSDPQGNVYVITTDGTVHKYNSAGVLADTFQVPVPDGYSALRQVIVDEVGDVIVGATKLDTGGRIFMFRAKERPDGETFYDRDWTVQVPYGIEAFSVRGGQLAILGSGGTAPASEDYTLALYSGTFSAAPLFVWGRSAPTPSNALEISSVGDVFVTSEPAADRALGSATDDWDISNVKWSPHEEYEATTRMNSWHDARQVEGLVHGDRVEVLPDRRFLATSSDNEDDPDNVLTTGQPGGFDADNANVHSPPLDNLANRDLYAPEHIGPGAEQPLRAPRYDTVSLPWPAINFDASEPGFEDFTGTLYTGNILLDRESEDGPFGYKSDSDSDTFLDSSGSNANTRSVLPAHAPYVIPSAAGGAVGNGFTFTQAYVLPPKSNQPMCIWATEFTSAGANVRMGIVYNARYEGGTGWFITPGTITLWVQQVLTGPTTINFVSCSETLWRQIGAATGDEDGNARGFVVLSIVNAGIKDPGGAAEFVEESVFRVNGRHFGAFTFTDMDRGQTFMNFGGHRYHNASNPTTTDLFDSDNFADGDGTITNFNGLMLEQLCFYHHDASGDANLGPADVSLDGGTLWGAVQPIDSVLTKPPLSYAVASGTMDITTYGGTDTTKQNYTRLATTVERLEGYLCHRWGSADVLPATTSGGEVNGLYLAHPFSSTRVPFGFKSGYNGFEVNADAALNSPLSILAKFAGSNGKAIWAQNASGIGYGLALDDGDHPMVVGPITVGDTVSARRVIDQGSTFSVSTADGAWTYTGAAQTFRSPKLKTDSAGDLYWPRVTSANSNDVLKLARDDGTVEFTYSLPLDAQRVQSVAFPFVLPLYNDSTITGPEFMYVGSTDGVVTGTSLLYKVLLVSNKLNVASGQSLRRHQVVCIGDGDIKVVDSGVVSTPTGGAGALNQDSPYNQAVQLFGVVFLTDGETYHVYDPRLGTVVPLVPTDGGELPKRARILTAWRGRLIATRSADDPYEIYSSELGNPFGWDRFPAALSTTQAWSGRAAGVGRAPDIVNAFIPMSDDEALIGCDSSIYRMTGDPAARGDVDIVTDKVGIAYGGAWTKDPYGRLYFFNSRGGVSVMAPGGGIERVSVNRIERRLQDVDLTEYKIVLEWDYQREGLIVWQVPWTIKGVAHKCWFFETKTGAWWEDTWGSTGLQPSCVTVFDGDKPDDRKVIFGCEDGFVRYIDNTQDDDDTDAIDSLCRVGPLIPAGQGTEFRFSRPQLVLASEQDGVEVSLFASSLADKPGTALAKRWVDRGRSTYLPMATRGAAVWLQLRNNKKGQSWSLEDCTVQVNGAGGSLPR